MKNKFTTGKQFADALQKIIAKHGRASIKILGNSNSHGVPVGATTDVTSYSNVTSDRLNMYVPTYGTYYSFILHDIELISVDPLTPKEIKEQIAEHKSAIAELEAKLAFIEEHGVENYDEDVFKVWSVLQEVNKSGVTDIQKAKAIVKLVHG